MNKIAIIITVVLLTNCRNENREVITDDKSSNEIFSDKAVNPITDPFILLDKDSVKKVYGDKFTDLRNIINKYDPIGLIASGAPDDEYEAEVKTIIVQLDKNKATEQQVHDLVYREFVRWFNDESTAGPKDFYKDMAKDIFKLTDKTTTR